MGRFRNRRRFHELFLEAQGKSIVCKFFRTPYEGFFGQFFEGVEVQVCGKGLRLKGGKIEFHHPEVHIQKDEGVKKEDVVPIYSETEGLKNAYLRKLIWRALKEVEASQESLESLPAPLIKKQNLMPYLKAIKKIHRPLKEDIPSLLEFKHPAQKRVIFDEFFELQLAMMKKKAQFKKEKGVEMKKDSAKAKELVKTLPFHLTNAQKKVFQEVIEDLKKKEPMSRLIQGDVGSGKTLVAFLSMLHAIENGYQTALMAPTEVLAEQHYANAKKLLTPLGVQVVLLTGQVKGKKREIIYESLKTDKVHVCIGTHALIQKGVEFGHLGLVVIDEQHRFGVDQRLKLVQKGFSPHFLLMTATPIPRTLALTAYGDLDVSVIDEMPQGRQSVITKRVSPKRRKKVLEFLEKEVASGRQAYVIFPLIEESEKLTVKNAVDGLEKLKETLPHLSYGLLHGKIKSEEKESVMRDFYSGKVQVLVSTTVVEVGVDVPQATIMWIESAERFGLSQLHQLRGRVGRGDKKSYCILMCGEGISPEAYQRLEFMEKNQDGFKVAEMDLEIRGPGELLGKRQSGLPHFKMAHLIRDKEILILARKSCLEILSEDETLQKKENQILKKKLQENLFLGV